MEMRLQRLWLKKKQTESSQFGCFCCFHQKLPGKIKYFAFANSPPDDLVAALLQI